MITRRTLLQGALAILSGPAVPAPVDQADIYVATTGNDGWSGRADGPVVSLQRAKELVAELRRQQPQRDSPVVVAMRGGLYHLDQPFKLVPEDSGTEASPTIYQAFGDERPVLSGGVRIGGWDVADDGRWRTTLDDVRTGRWSFTQLFVDDQRRYRPRLPARGYFRIARQMGRGAFGFTGDDIRADWTNLDDVEVLAFHDWSASRMRIRSVRADEGSVVFTGASWKVLARDHRYLVDNVREALHAPGQWYLDRPRGELIYLPKPGERPDRSEVIAPRLEQVLVLQGDPFGRRWLQHVQFRALTFAHTNWTLPATGQDFPQAEIGLNAAVVAFGARDVVFERCTVRHTGGYGIAFGAGSRGNRLDGCGLVDLGAGGVKIGHAGAASWDAVGRLSNDPEMHVSHHVVRNCRIAHGGRLHPAGVGIWIGQSSHNSITHNDVVDFYQTGISSGWTWGYGRSDAHDNDIGFNHVSRIGQGVMSDMGGIYTLGTQPGTVVHDNHVHDIVSFGYGGWGLYTDEGSTGIVMERNLVHHTKTGGFFQHTGRDNVIRDNIFAFATEAQLEATDPELHLAFTFARNIVYWDNASPLMAGCHSAPSPCAINFRLDHNIYWNVSGKPIVFPGRVAFETWRATSGQDVHSRVDDPRFVDAANGDFRLRPESPALLAGFEPFDSTQAGRLDLAPPGGDLPDVPPAFS